MNRIMKFLISAAALSAVCLIGGAEVAATDRGQSSTNAVNTFDASAPAWCQEDLTGFATRASCTAPCKGGESVSCSGVSCAAVDYSHCVSSGGPDGPEYKSCKADSIGF